MASPDAADAAAANHATVPEGRILSIQRYGVHDGPGIRSTVFMKGCPLTCGWCHNPEGRRHGPEVWVIEGRCITCGSCLEDCPHPVELELNQPPTVDRQRCIRCGTCVEHCPTGARQMLGRTVTVDQLLSDLLRDRPFYEQSGGGVTFSGGEPLLQRKFLMACLKACRRHGLHSAVDTSGFAPRRQMLELALWADLILFDLKIVDNARHIEHTGVPVLPILQNLYALDAAGVGIWIRLPFVPGLNDDSDNLKALADLVNELDHTRRVHILPYHATGRDKHARLGRAEPGVEPEPPSKANITKAARLLAGQGLDVRIGG